MSYSPSLKEIIAILQKYTSKNYQSNCKTRPDGKLELSLNGVFEEIVKTPGKTRYVTHKQLDQKLKDFKQDLMVELHDTFATKTDLKESEARINQKLEALIQIVMVQGEQIKVHGEQIHKLIQAVEKQGEKIEAQGQQIQKVNETLNFVVESLGSIHKRLDSMEGRLDSMENRLDKLESK